LDLSGESCRENAMYTDESDAVPGCVSSLQPLIGNVVQDRDRVSGTCAVTGELVIMPEKPEKFPF
jgi:hypothetical protein